MTCSSVWRRKCARWMQLTPRSCRTPWLPMTSELPFPLSLSAFSPFCFFPFFLSLHYQNGGQILAVRICDASLCSVLSPPATNFLHFWLNSTLAASGLAACSPPTSCRSRLHQHLSICTTMPLQLYLCNLATWQPCSVKCRDRCFQRQHCLTVTALPCYSASVWGTCLE